MIENLSSKVDFLSGQTPSTVDLDADKNRPESLIPTSRPIEVNELIMEEGQNMTRVTVPQDIPTRSSSLPPPNQKYSDDIVNKLLESLKNVTQQNLGLPRLPKAISTTMPMFDGRNDILEHFENLFTTSLKVYPNISEEEQIHYFHSLLRMTPCKHNET